ncbi:MAG: SDR family oxidoreductase, partial [Candidatus Delongbacteria bacterium]|nr:SDR family oxidoreductase [Candidatus Delongbacteria bacterium]
MKRKILLTGATGFLGSFILNGLLEKGYFPVILARPSKDQSAYERISTVLKWFGKNIQDHPELKIFEGSLEEEKFGLSDNEFIYMSENTDELIHCASDTDFAEKNREKIEKTNVVSLE